MRIVRALWSAIQKPYHQHPQYQRIIAYQNSIPPWYVVLIEGLALVFVLPMMLFTDTIYGMTWVISISNTLIKDRQNGAAVLLSVTPEGPAGIYWITTLACLYRHHTFTTINRFDVLMMRFVLMMLILFVLVGETSVVAWVEPSVIEILLHSVVYGGAVLLALYIDHVLTIMLVVLLGLSVPEWLHNRTDTHLAAFTGFTLIQLSIYTLTAGLCFMVLPTLVDFIGIPLWLREYLVLGATLMTFVGLRVGAIYVFWEFLERRLHLSTEVYDFARALRN